MSIELHVIFLDQNFLLKTPPAWEPQPFVPSTFSLNKKTCRQNPRHAFGTSVVKYLSPMVFCVTASGKLMTRPRPRPRGPKNPLFWERFFRGEGGPEAWLVLKLEKFLGFKFWVSYICATFFFLKDPTGCQLILGRKSPGGVLGWWFKCLKLFREIRVNKNGVHQHLNQVDLWTFGVHVTIHVSCHWSCCPVRFSWVVWCYTPYNNYHNTWKQAMPKGNEYSNSNHPFSVS